MSGNLPGEAREAHLQAEGISWLTEVPGVGSE